MIAALLLVAGQAQARDVQICAQWTPDFEEAGFDDDDGLDGNGDGIVDNDKSDRLTTNAPIAAHGLFAHAEYRLTFQGTPGAWQSAAYQYLEVGGADGGCTDVLSLPTNVAGKVEVRLTAYSIMLSGPHNMPVFDQDDELTRALGLAESTVFEVTNFSGPRADVDLGAGDHRIDTAIVMAWALDREDAGTPAMTYDVFTCSPPASGDLCADLPPDTNGGGFSPVRESLWVSNRGNMRRTLHELGHAITHGLLTDHWQQSWEWTNSDDNGVAADSLCPIDISGDGGGMHYTHSDEASSAAIVEGIATYYAATILNRVDENDCGVAHQEYDWNHNGTIELSREDQEWYSCEGAPLPGVVGVDARDYFAAQCGYPTSTTDDFSLATEYDWIRGFWDLDTGRGLTFQIIAEVFAAASPHDWHVEPTCPIDDGVCQPAPWARMQLAALGLESTYPGVWGAFLNECNNGICR